MANTKSAQKQARVAIRRKALNKTTKGLVKTTEKKIRSLVKSGDNDGAVKLLPSFQSAIDRAAKKGVLHKNTASRHKARVAALFKAKK